MASLNNLYINTLYFNDVFDDSIYFEDFYFDGDMAPKKIHTFRLVPDYKKIESFVAEEVDKIPDDEIILRRDNPISFWSLRRKDDVVYDCEAYSLRKDTLDDKDHYVKRLMHVLNTGEESWFEPENIRHRYKSDSELFSFSVGYLPYSIQTTEDLYKLGILEMRKFDSELLQYGDLSKVAELFTLSDEIHSQDLGELEKLITYGVIPEDNDRLINYTNSTKVYKNLRRDYK